MTENPEMHKFETGKLKLKITLAADRNAVDPVVQSVMELVRQIKCDPAEVRRDRTGPDRGAGECSGPRGQSRSVKDR